TTQNGCPNTDTVQVTVRPLPVANAGPDHNACSGDTITLGTSSTSGYSYSWTPSTGLSSTTVSNPTFIVSNVPPNPDTLYFFVMDKLSGCTTNDTVRIIVNRLPLVAAATIPDSICTGQHDTLTASGANLYGWANSLNPSVTIGTGNVFVVTPAVTTTYILTGI